MVRDRGGRKTVPGHGLGSQCSQCVVECPRPSHSPSLGLSFPLRKVEGLSRWPRKPLLVLSPVLVGQREPWRVPRTPPPSSAHPPGPGPSPQGPTLGQHASLLSLQILWPFLMPQPASLLSPWPAPLPAPCFSARPSCQGTDQLKIVPAAFSPTAAQRAGNEGGKEAHVPLSPTNSQLRTMSSTPAWD